MNALAHWLETSEAYDVLDDAVMGCLLQETVLEICEDFDVSVSDFGAALDVALRNGF